MNPLRLFCHLAFGWHYIEVHCFDSYVLRVRRLPNGKLYVKFNGTYLLQPDSKIRGVNGDYYAYQPLTWEQEEGTPK